MPVVCWTLKQCLVAKRTAVKRNRMIWIFCFTFIFIFLKNETLTWENVMLNPHLPFKTMGDIIDEILHGLEVHYSIFIYYILNWLNNQVAWQLFLVQFLARALMNTLTLHIRVCCLVVFLYLDLLEWNVNMIGASFPVTIRREGCTY